MGKQANLKDQEKKGQPSRWPFDPMQSGDHEAVRAPEDIERIQEDAGIEGERNRSPKGDRR